MNKLMQWVNERMSVNQVMEDHLTKYYAPKNFNFFYFFGWPCWCWLISWLPVSG